MKQQISVIIPAYKNTTLLLHNLQHNLPFLVGCEIIIVNDDPTTPLRPYLKKYPDIKIIESRQNQGFSKAVNLGIQQATGQYLLLINTDVIIQQLNLRRLLNSFTQDQELFAISFYQQEKAHIIAGKNRIYWEKGLFQHQRADNLEAGITAWAEGGAGLFDKEKMLKLGCFDPIYSPFYWEDIDLCYRAWKAGYFILFDPTAKTIHQHESTIGKYFSSKIKTVALRNQLIFIWKNISDKELIGSHRKNLGRIFFSLLKDSGLTAGKSFFQALLLLPEILKKRREQMKTYRVTDQAVLKKFNS